MADPIAKPNSAIDASAAPTATKPAAPASSKKKMAPKPAVKAASSSKVKSVGSAEKSGSVVPPKPAKQAGKASQPNITVTVQPKPSKSTPSATETRTKVKSPAKQVSTKSRIKPLPPKNPNATPQVPVAKVRKPSTRTPKEKNKTSIATRPTMSDGKVERAIWQPSDGNGDPSPELVENFRTKKPGHPTWKLYTGRNVPKQPTATNPPHFVYLDDKAAWDILHSKHWSAHDKHRFWSFDFTPQGRLSFTRANRGRPVYEKDGKSFCSIRRTKDKRYWFNGCHPAPADDGSSVAAPAASKETVVDEASSAAVAAKQVVMETQAIENQAVEDASVAEQRPAAEEISTTEAPSVPEENLVLEQPPMLEQLQASESELQEPLAKVASHAEPISTKLENESEGTERPPTPPPSAPQDPQRLLSPSPVHLNTLDKHQEQRQQTVNSISPCPPAQPAKRRSPSGSVTSPAPKRQRKGIERYDVPQEVQFRDAELVQLRKTLYDSRERETAMENEISNLRQRATFYHRALLESSARVEASEKRGQAFRTLALQLYARAVDQQDVLAERHKALLKIMEDAANLTAAAERSAVSARRELDPVERMHGDLDEIMDDAERVMQDAGLQREYDAFVQEAMIVDQ
ncbi:hypothetical protein SLS58_000030 [Diplodia intermedia]|uniref:Uncharacterized protein n=1 Tax=Diplodia intermedia TaxID=856260 RepID=A0ABR3U5F0_9PEZI